MPELAEVEYYRRRWDPGLGRRVTRVSLHPRVRDFRDTDTARLAGSLPGAVLRGSEARGKQMLFRFSRGIWLGIHLGMTGRLEVAAGEATAGRHDHLILHQSGRALIFSDPRQFGRIRFSESAASPEWWASLPPSLLSEEFTPEILEAFLRRRARAPIKAVLMIQERFPGIGNWMADEILWRAEIHPATPAGRISFSAARVLWREIRLVARTAMHRIGEEREELPRGWLFHQRWSDGGLCPRTGVLLVRETIGGRTSCWSPGRQKRPRS